MARDTWTGSRVEWEHRPTARGGRKVVRAGIAEREEALAKVPLFEGLPRRHLRRLAKASGVTERREGATVVREGAAGSVFFVILDGKAKVVRRGRTVARLKRGDFFGEMSLLDGQPRGASVVTETDARFLTLSGKSLSDMLARDPLLATRIMKTMAARLRKLEKPPVG